MRRRRNFYGSPPPSGPMRPAPGALVEVVKVEEIKGATALAHLLGLRSAKEFYRLYEANREGVDPIPVRYVEGRGLCADSHTLLTWWARVHGAMVAA